MFGQDKYQSIFGLIGKKIHYSFSKNFFLNKFKKESINNCYYVIYDIPDIKQVDSIFKNPYIKGCNVTIPYKKSIIPYLTKINSIAKKIGSVNVIKINKYEKIGYNTDYIGFEGSFIKNINQILYSKNTLKALILGTGGVSKSISYVLKKWKIKYQYISRKKQKGMLIYEDINKNLLKEYRIIINCTPLGTYPNINSFPPLPYQYISDQHYFYDLVYNPNKTLFLRKGEKNGATIKNGLEMLYIQAEESWKIWNNNNL
ncbi:shikimate dehydrogenase family protein [Blattabacterium cuenoti]|uniref:shikimate dehydrogenase family protein n=1 Tax=Blattabacterium cuenoti TaxID=1653831 RepID=UPI00163CDB60|nr:shikimate dehydrogenase [Blattabacterium cuenoti]